MPKIITVFRRKRGLSRQEFIDYYETRHVPLIESRFGRFFLDYRRSFLRDDGAERGGAADFDVVTEVWIKDEEALEQVLAAAAEPAAAAEIAADEERFIDRASIRIYLTDEYPRTARPTAGG